jgi:hypothetical protein
MEKVWGCHRAWREPANLDRLQCRLRDRFPIDSMEDPFDAARPRIRMLDNHVMGSAERLTAFGMVAWAWREGFSQ